MGNNNLSIQKDIKRSHFKSLYKVYQKMKEIYENIE